MRTPFRLLAIDFSELSKILGIFSGTEAPLLSAGSELFGYSSSGPTVQTLFDQNEFDKLLSSEAVIQSTRWVRPRRAENGQERTLACSLLLGVQTFVFLYSNFLEPMVRVRLIVKWLDLLISVPRIQRLGFF